MKAQNVFNKVVRHLYAQGVPAMDDNVCLYRTDDGKKCAVGGLIYDREYKPKMEMNDVFKLVEKDLLPKRLVEHKNLLRTLQSAHDRLNVGADLRSKTFADSLREIARTYNLSDKAVNW